MLFKEKFRNGHYTPWLFLQSMNKTIGYNKFTQMPLSDSEDTEEELNDPTTNVVGSNCVGCLCPRISTWIFMPCRHAKFCAYCGQQIMEMRQTCPIYRSDINERLQMCINSYIIHSFFQFDFIYHIH